MFLSTGESTIKGDTIGCGFRDFLFDLNKENFKQAQQTGIHQECETVRQRTTLLLEKDRETVFQIIDEYEREQMQNVEMQASNVSIAKEILKRFGF